MGWGELFRDSSRGTGAQTPSSAPGFRTRHSVQNEKNTTVNNVVTLNVKSKHYYHRMDGMIGLQRWSPLRRKTVTMTTRLKRKHFCL